MSVREEKEALSRALEAERQANMNTVMLNMMETVKTQKVANMKAIKRLGTEKSNLNAKFKDFQAENVSLKMKLDASMKSYQAAQAKFESLSSTGAESSALEGVASEMSQILVSIAADRGRWLQTKDVAKKVKTRLAKVEEELTGARADLVVTAGLLDQNDKMRVQIQEEEREKARETIAAELLAAKQQLGECLCV